MAEDAEFGGNADGGNNETVKRSPSRKSSGPTEYLTSLHSNADSAPLPEKWVSLDSFGYNWGSQLKVLPE